jgi:hypothetical protein
MPAVMSSEVVEGLGAGEVTPPMDEAFRKALEGRCVDWALRAIAGYTMRQFCETAEARKQANDHGLARALTPDERAAWTFGFTWVDRSN